MKISWEKLDFTDNLDDEFDDDIDYEDKGSQLIPLTFMGGNTINSILGPINLNSNHNIIDYYDIWIMDTNFDITQKVSDQISKIEGIEIFYPVSRYKSIVGFGKLFKASEVKVNVEYILTGKHKHFILINSIEDIKIKNDCFKIYKKISKYPYWAMYIFPNGQIEQIFLSDQNDFENKLQQFIEYQNKSQGMLIYADYN